jgi:hypothetical protein
VTEKAKKLTSYEARAGAFGGRLSPATFAAWALFACGTEKFSGKILTDSNLEDGNAFFRCEGQYIYYRRKNLPTAKK